MGSATLNLRLAALRTRLVQEDLDGLLVSGPENRRYLSGFTASDPDWGVLLVGRETASLLTDFRYREWAAQEATAFEVLLYRESLAVTLAALLQQQGVRRLGFEAAHLTYQEYQRLTQAAEEAGLFLEWRPQEDLVEGLREVKEPGELAAIRQALELTEEVLQRVAAALTPGTTERQVAWEIEKRLREAGAEEVAFPPMVAAGPNSARPHHQPGAYILREGEPIILDLGARLAGYCADLTRTFVLGPADDQFRQIYRLVRQAQERALQGLKAGMDSVAADALAREEITAAGYGEAFGHSLGHGVGLAVHEAPALSPVKERARVLKAGSVVTVEPGIYLPGWGGVRLENLVLLTPHGAQVLNRMGYYEW
jgi:Xaa-Pro aminopeptidase